MLKKSINTKAMYEALHEVENAKVITRTAKERWDRETARFSGMNDNGEQGMVRKAEESYKASEANLMNKIDAYTAATAPLTEAIKAAEGRATARTITAGNILDTLDYIERELKISKKAMNGIHIRADINAQKFPGAYKYIPESTHFQATYKNGSWRITSITREVCRQGMHIEVTHTEESRKAILDRMSKF